MNVKTIAKVKPVFPFESYAYFVSPIPAADGGGFMFTMPDLPGVMADGETEARALADGREAFITTVSAMVDMGQEVPPPLLIWMTSRPLLHQARCWRACRVRCIASSLRVPRPKVCR